MDLKRYLVARQKEVDRALDRFLPRESVAPATIHKAMRYSLFAGGKRLRPILCLAATEDCGGRSAAAIPHACAVECIHTYSLIHDDLPSMDNDDLRRGRPTCHKVFGDAIAILAGDALLTVAFEIVTRAKPVRRYDLREILREITVAAGSRKLIAGQVADLEAEGQTLSREQVRSIHQNKTAALLLMATVVYYLVPGTIGHTEIRYVLPMHAALIVFAGLGFVTATTCAGKLFRQNRSRREHEADVSI